MSADRCLSASKRISLECRGPCVECPVVDSTSLPSRTLLVGSDRFSDLGYSLKGGIPLSVRGSKALQEARRSNRRGLRLISEMHIDSVISKTLDPFGG